MSIPPGNAMSLRIAGVCERDIDLLLLEEFIASSGFARWFLAATGLCENMGSVANAARSVTHSSGESDLEVEFQAGNERTTVLIENKIGAALQPEQAARYRLRGSDYVSKSRCNRYFTVIVAPDRYFSDPRQMKGFDCRLSYEQLIGWFSEERNQKPRARYKVALLQSAIEKATLGYQPDTDQPVTDFFREYWKIATTAAPNLGMLPPRDRPSGSGRVTFKSRILSELKADVAHKTAKGIVDLHLRGRGHQILKVEAVLGPFLRSGMEIATAAKSAAVRLRVPLLDRTQPAATQKSELLQALDAVEQLQSWASQHRDRIASISDS